MNLPSQDAAALTGGDQARRAMRRVIRERRGHHYLWIWGATRIAMPLSAQFAGDAAARYFWLLCLPGLLASMAVGLPNAARSPAAEARGCSVSPP